jgi:hypothetical protein
VGAEVVYVRAGQFVIDAAQLVMVMISVSNTVEVLRALPPLTLLVLMLLVPLILLVLLGATGAATTW